MSTPSPITSAPKIKKDLKKTRALITIHFAGNSEMDDIMMIAKQHNLGVVEDCAHAIETLYNGVPVGTIGDFGCFAFMQTKTYRQGKEVCNKKINRFPQNFHHVVTWYVI